jgi:hypothetical protein
MTGGTTSCFCLMRLHIGTRPAPTTACPGEVGSDSPIMDMGITVTLYILHRTRMEAGRQVQPGAIRYCVSCHRNPRSAGAERALELGPGAALSHMASALFPDGRARAVEDFHTLAGLRTWLRRA